MKKLLLSAASGLTAMAIAFPAAAHGLSLGTNAGLGLGLGRLHVQAAADMSVSTSTPQVDSACMQNAVVKREDALVAALQKLITAVQTRRDMLKTAWAIGNARERDEAIHVAWKTFKGSWHEFRKSRRAAWDQFRKDAKDCRADPSVSTSESVQGNASL